MADGSRLIAQASWLMTNKKQIGAPPPRQGPSRQFPFFLGNEPKALSHDPWAMSHEPQKVNLK